jgi:hypothetical protein
MTAGVIRIVSWVALALCLFAPFAKDFAQIFVLTRHFNWTATCWGMGGALVGWGQQLCCCEG